MSTATRYAIAAGVGVTAWLLWFVGGLWLASEVGRAYGVLPALCVIVVDVAVGIGAPVWLFVRGTGL